MSSDNFHINESGCKDAVVEKSTFFTAGDIHSNRFDSRSELINTWEGKVTDIDEENIYAILYDFSDDTIYEFEFEFRDLNEGDKELVEKGALFFLYLGYYTDDKGTKRKSSHIEFRRFPTNLSEEYINKKLDAVNALNFDDIWE